MLRIGIVGCGSSGREHVKAYKNIKDIEVAGVYDIDESAALKFANEYNVPSMTFEELISNIDILDIASPTHTHLSIIANASGLVKKIICEAPITRTLEEAKEVVGICKSKNITIAPIGLVGNAGPLSKVKDIIKKNPDNAKATIRITRRRNDVSEDWRLNFEKSGGVILDLLIQDIMFLQKHIGRIKKVMANTTHKENNSYDEYALLSLKFDNGAIAHLNGSWNSMIKSGDEFEFAFKDSIAVYNSEINNPLQITRKSDSCYNTSKESPLTINEYSSILIQIIEAFINDDVSPVTIDEAIDSLKVAVSAIESAVNKKAIEI